MAAADGGGGSSMTLVGRAIGLIVLCFLVGLLLSRLGITARGILTDTSATILSVFGLLADWLQWAIPYILLDAVIVVPLVLLGAPSPASGDVTNLTWELFETADVSPSSPRVNLGFSHAVIQKTRSRVFRDLLARFGRVRQCRAGRQIPRNRHWLGRRCAGFRIDRRDDGLCGRPYLGRSFQPRGDYRAVRRRSHSGRGA